VQRKEQNADLRETLEIFTNKKFCFATNLEIFEVVPKVSNFQDVSKMSQIT